MFQFMCARKESPPLNDLRLKLLYCEREKAEVVGKGNSGGSQKIQTKEDKLFLRYEEKVRYRK